MEYQAPFDVGNAEIEVEVGGDRLVVIVKEGCTEDCAVEANVLCCRNEPTSDVPPIELAVAVGQIPVEIDGGGNKLASWSAAEGVKVSWGLEGDGVTGRAEGHSASGS